MKLVTYTNDHVIHLSADGDGLKVMENDNLLFTIRPNLKRWGKVLIVLPFGSEIDVFTEHPEKPKESDLLFSNMTSLGGGVY